MGQPHHSQEETVRRGLLFSTFALALSAFALPQGAAAQDPGLPDTMRVQGGPLYLNQSLPIEVVLQNDDSVSFFFAGLEIVTVDGGFARFDSAVWVNRMADPKVLTFRGSVAVGGTNGMGASPDSIRYGAVRVGFDSKYMPAGDDAITLLYFTGITPGEMLVASGEDFPHGGGYSFGSTLGSYQPAFVDLVVEVREGAPPPIVEVSASIQRLTAGSTAEFEIQASSPAGFPLSLTTPEIHLADDPQTTPVGELSIGDSLPATLGWSSDIADIGIWDITFNVCDSAGVCTPVSLQAQVVSDENGLLTFESSSVTGYTHASGMFAANLDDDPYPEIVSTGDATRYSPVLTVYQFSEESGLVEEFQSLDNEDPVTLPQVAFFTGDDYPDMVSLAIPPGSSGPDWRVTSWMGDGSAGYQRYDDDMTTSGATRSSAAGDFTGDGKLDFLAISSSVNLYPGDGTGDFSSATTFAVGVQSWAALSADLNRDGKADVALGTTGGLHIIFGNGAGGFSPGPSYNQTYGAADVDAAWAGTDFNGDGILDLSLATPSVGGDSSEILVYLGDGTGHFTQVVVRTVLGQAFATEVGDFNGDLALDIAYINGSHRTVGILFGDGAGSFADEIRFPVGPNFPRRFVALDADLDGDLDIAVALTTGQSLRELMILVNSANPDGYSASAADFSALDHSEISITAPSGREINSISSTIATAEYFQRDLDGDAALDDFVCMSAAESGAHTLKLSLKPNTSENSPTTVTYQLNGQPHRLAQDLPVDAGGVEFEIYPDGVSPIAPANGAFTPLASPSFLWPQNGTVEFEIAEDLSFGSILYSAVVSANSYTVPLNLSAPDTALYYWRVRQQGAGEWDYVAAVNVLPAGPATCGDVDGTGSINISDVLFLINNVFNGGDAPDPLSAGDVDGSGSITIADAVHLISYIFLSGPPPVCP